MDLEQHFKTYAQNLAYTDPERSLTYDDLHKRLKILVSWLKANGVTSQSKLAFYAPNGPDHFLFLLGAACIGYRFVPLNYKTPLTEFVPTLQGPQDFLILSNEGLDPNLKVPHCLCLKEAHASGICDPVILNSIDSPILELKTSGSSGVPKIRSFSLRAILASAEGSNHFLKLTKLDRWGLLLPLYHVGGLMIFMRTFLVGAAVVHLSNTKWEKGEVQAPMTCLSLVPTQLIRLLNLPSQLKEQALSHLRTHGLRFILMGGDKTPPWALERAFKEHLPCLPTYGLTEMLSQVTCAPLNQELTTAGVVMPQRELKIEGGEIFVKGPMLFLEHSEQNKSTDEWYATGDLGELSADGELTVLGRKDRLFIVGGENMAPGEIERHILELPGVIFAHVYPEPDSEFGQVPIAKVLVEGNWTPETLSAALQKRLPRYQIPRKILMFHIDSTPMSAGKIHPRDLA